MTEGAEGERGCWLCLCYTGRGPKGNSRQKQKSDCLPGSVFAGRTKCTFAVCLRNPACAPEGLGGRTTVATHWVFRVNVNGGRGSHSLQPPPQAHRRLPPPPPQLTALNWAPNLLGLSFPTPPEESISTLSLPSPVGANKQVVEIQFPTYEISWAACR